MNILYLEFALFLNISKILKTIKDPTINIEKAWLQYIMSTVKILAMYLIKLNFFTELTFWKFNKIKNKASKKVRMYDLNSCVYFKW